MNAKKILFRIIVDLVIFASIFIAWWWVALLLTAIAIMVFRDYYESFLAGLILDALYGIPGETFFGLNLLATFVILVLFVTSYFMKRNLALYQR